MHTSIYTRTHVRVEKMLEEPGLENRDGAVWQSTLGAPDINVVDGGGRGFGVSPEEWCGLLVGEAKLLCNGVFEAPEVFGHQTDDQTSVRCGVIQSGDVFERRHDAFDLVDVLLVPSIHLIEEKEEERKKLLK